MSTIEDAKRVLGTTDQGDKKDPRRIIAVHLTKNRRTYYTADSRAVFTVGSPLPVIENR